MTALCIIQARMGSRRFPGKVLAPLGGVPMIAWLVQAVRKAGMEPVIATTAEWRNVYLRSVIRDVRFFVGRSPEDDVLGRYAECAREAYERMSPYANTIIRLTADCPLHSADVIRRTLEQFQAPADYLFSHWLEPLPKGQEVEVFTRALLERADREATDPYDREHVTPWMRRHVGDRPALYTGENLSVDTVEDLHRLEAMLCRKG